MCILMFPPGTKVRGVALVAVDGIIGTPELEVDEEKPWRKPGVYVQVGWEGKHFPFNLMV